MELYLTVGKNVAKVEVSTMSIRNNLCNFFFSVLTERQRVDMAGLLKRTHTKVTWSSVDWHLKKEKTLSMKAFENFLIDLEEAMVFSVVPITEGQGNPSVRESAQYHGCPQ